MTQESRLSELKRNDEAYFQKQIVDANDDYFYQNTLFRLAQI